MELSKINKLLISKYRDFLENDIYPIEMQSIYGSFKHALPLLDLLRAKAKQNGLFAPHLPRSAGGLGLSLVEFASVSEVLGRSPLGHYVFNCQAPDIGNMELMYHFAADHLKQDFLIPLQKGEIRSCFAMTEPAHA
ncbi:MAG TPA: acyl-CoA dehydrogenase family protein, partial [Lunatimonas sp.]|nr:acyl-CoA dehydrogenase family protein [Lunatimonas sp.]